MVPDRHAAWTDIGRAEMGYSSRSTGSAWTFRQVSHGARWCSEGAAHTDRVVSAGVLAVVRSNVAQDRPYTGLTEIRSGEVAEDLASYLVDSEQVRLCGCRLHIIIGPLRPWCADWQICPGAAAGSCMLATACVHTRHTFGRQNSSDTCCAQL